MQWLSSGAHRDLQPHSRVPEMSAASNFLLRVNQAKRWDDRFDRETFPLFPLWLILEADGTLAEDFVMPGEIGKLTAEETR